MDARLRLPPLRVLDHLPHGLNHRRQLSSGDSAYSPDEPGNREGIHLERISRGNLR